MEFRPARALDGPIEIDIEFRIRRPKSVKRKLPDCRPDLDNFVKAVMDSLDSFWLDDGQIVRLTAQKAYGDPQIAVLIRRAAA